MVGLWCREFLIIIIISTCFGKVYKKNVNLKLFTCKPFLMYFFKHNTSEISFIHFSSYTFHCGTRASSTMGGKLVYYTTQHRNVAVSFYFDFSFSCIDVINIFNTSNPPLLRFQSPYPRISRSRGYIGIKYSLYSGWM